MKDIVRAKISEGPLPDTYRMQLVTRDGHSSECLFTAENIRDEEASKKFAEFVISEMASRVRLHNNKKYKGDEND